MVASRMKIPMENMKIPTENGRNQGQAKNTDLLKQRGEFGLGGAEADLDSELRNRRGGVVPAKHRGPDGARVGKVEEL